MTNYQAYFPDILLETRAKTLSSNCFFPISIGQTYHQGDHLKALVDLINKNFSSCNVVICDSLYRHTQQLTCSLSKKECYQLSIGVGDRWIEQNEAHLKQLSINSSVTRWDYWLIDKASFQKNLSAIEFLIETKDTFRQAIHESASDFLQRYRNSHSVTVNDDLAKELCVTYLKEECAMVVQSWKKLGYPYLIYPQKITSALDQVLKHCINLHKPDALTWLTAKFKHKKNSLVNYSVEHATFEEIFSFPESQLSLSTQKG